MIKDIVKSGFNLEIKVKGSSMSPFLKNGDKVSVKSKERYSVGDIVLVNVDMPLLGKSQTHCHRIIFKYRKKYLIKGDNQAWKDGFYTSKEIIGFVYRRNGKIMKNYFKKIISIISLKEYLIMRLTSGSRSKLLLLLKRFIYTSPL